MKVKMYVNYQPKLRGMRVGFAYIKTKKYFLGYYIGYSGGGTYTDNFFKIDHKLTEDSLIKFDTIKYFPKELRKYLERCVTAIWDLCYDDDMIQPILREEILNTFDCFTGDDGQPIFLYETKGFYFELMKFLSSMWCLLTYFN